MFNLEVPINSLSLGQVSVGILRELYNRNIFPNIFPISGNVDLSSYKTDQNFIDWLSFCMQKGPKEFHKVDTNIKLWHIAGSWNNIHAKNQVLFTAHETDFITETEKNILSTKNKVFVTSQYSKETFSNYGVNNVEYCPNFFDSTHFYKKEVQKKTQEDVITFGLFGKFERRKLTSEILSLWAKKFGNNDKYRLNCCITNPHVAEDWQVKNINILFNGKVPWNISFIPFQQKNEVYNDILNSIDIDLSGLSGAEGWNLPAFQNLCLGKIGIFLDAHGHKSYIDEAQCIKVQPSRKVEIYDNFFFKKGDIFNQGNMYMFSHEDCLNALDEAVEWKKNNLVVDNSNLVNKFTAANTVDILLSSVI
jgi:hypothetical protein